MVRTMRKSILRLTMVIGALLLQALPCSAGQLDDYYLQRFATTAGSTLEKAVLLTGSEATGVVHCGTPLKHSLQRDWSLLESATQKSLAKQLAAPVLSGSELTTLTSSGRFRIHYTMSGGDAIPSIAWVQTVAQTLENVASSYSSLGWRLAPTVSNAPYDVYLRDLASLNYYGQTTSTQSLPSSGYDHAYASFIEVDNDFLDSIYQNSLGSSLTAGQKALYCLQLAFSHEYHHAIQYGYNVFFDIWFAEATSSWYEDELYDDVNQVYNYLPYWFSGYTTRALDTDTDVSTGGGYGRWLFNRYLAEQHGASVVLSAWEKLATLNSPGSNADIPMVPVLESTISGTFSSSLGTDFAGFVRRLYLRNWSSHTGDLSLIPSVTPLASYSSYPVNATSLTLPHYSFAFYRFVPTATVANLRISINRTSGIQTSLFSRSGGTVTEITAASDGSYTVNGFGSMNPAADEAVLLVANSTNVDSHQASFTTSGQPATVTEPPNTPASTLPTTESDSSGGGGGGGGCFIATAAYGSYLHPHVRLLREFRDAYLLTSAPGRAFVGLYYRLSPPLADLIAGHEVLRVLTRLLLTPLVCAVAWPLASGVTLLLALSAGVLVRQRRTPPLQGTGS